MNPLLNPFPRAVLVRGMLYDIDWEARSAIWMLRVNEAADLTGLERLQLMLNRFYRAQVPEDLDEAVRMMAKFLDLGTEPKEREEAAPPRLFSFERDGTAIFTAILRQYGIDLERESCHWWKLMAMLGDLDPECWFARLLRLRKGYLDGTLTTEEQKELEALGEEGLPPDALPDPEEQQAIKAFLAELEAGEEVSG